MKIVSWDVGIKNLAYCIMEYCPDNKLVPFKIYEWGIINILSNTTLKCSFEDKSKNKPCLKDASFGSEINGIKYYFCKAHKLNHANLLTTHKTTVFESIKELKDKPSCEKCSKNAQWRCQDTYLCTAHKNTLINNENKGAALKSIKKMNCDKISIDEFKMTVFNILKKMKQFYDVEEVIIENQPAYKNPKMKTMANAVWDHFAIQGMVNKEITNSKINKVKFISPSNKLKVDDDNSIKLLSNTKDESEKYKMTKQLGIQYCKQLLKNDKEFLDLFNSHSKKDDLADCFLQGCWYLAINKAK